MRVIKFRLWDSTSLDVGGQKILEWDQVCELTEHGIYLEDILSGDHYTLIPMQFTGLTDDNGVEIYEGDIVKSGMTGAVYLVCWSDENSAWYKKMLNANTSDRPIYHDGSDQRIIGNIHQNPEILEGKV